MSDRKCFLNVLLQLEFLERKTVDNVNKLKKSKKISQNISIFFDKGALSREAIYYRKYLK